MTMASSSQASPSGHSVRDRVAASVVSAPIFGVVRTASRDEAERQARSLRDGGIELVEITFTVPQATTVVRGLLAERSDDGPPWIGMGSVINRHRALEALEAGAEFLVSPNVEPEVARIAKEAGVFLVLGALTPSEIVAADRLEADLVKVYPLPPVGGARYLSTIRGPLPDTRVLAAGGFGPEEIPEYRKAGATAFGIGAPLLGADADSSRRRIKDALDAARS